MAKFIELTRQQNESERKTVHVNVERVVKFAVNGNRTVLDMTDGASVWVTETPEDILHILEGGIVRRA